MVRDGLAGLQDSSRPYASPLRDPLVARVDEFGDLDVGQGRLGPARAAAQDGAVERGVLERARRSSDCGGLQARGACDAQRCDAPAHGCHCCCDDDGVIVAQVQLVARAINIKL